MGDWCQPGGFRGLLHTSLYGPGAVQLFGQWWVKIIESYISHLRIAHGRIFQSFSQRKILKDKERWKMIFNRSKCEVWHDSKINCTVRASELYLPSSYVYLKSSWSSQCEKVMCEPKATLMEWGRPLFSSILGWSNYTENNCVQRRLPNIKRNWMDVLECIQRRMAKRENDSRRHYLKNGWNLEC